MNPIRIKTDNRYKNGNIKTLDGMLRGNAETMEMKRMDVLMYAPIEMHLNPPIVVGHELGEALKKELNKHA